MSYAPNASAVPASQPRSQSYRVCLLSLIVVAVLGCELDQPYLDEDGPRYAGDFISEPPQERPFLRVVSYNLEFGRETEIAIEALRTPPLAGADFVLMQEMEAGGIEEIATALQMAYVYYPAGIKRGQDFGNAVLSRWPIAADRKLLLPHPDPYVGTRRTCTGASVVFFDGTEAQVYSAHTETMTLGLGGRLDQAETVLMDAARYSGPAIIAGDLNTSDPGSGRQTRELFRDHQFAWVSSEARNTADGYGASFLLDYVFARGLREMASGTYRGDAGSDHHPIWSELEF